MDAVTQTIGDMTDGRPQTTTRRYQDGPRTARSGSTHIHASRTQSATVLRYLRPAARSDLGSTSAAVPTYGVIKGIRRPKSRGPVPRCSLGGGAAHNLPSWLSLR